MCFFLVQKRLKHPALSGPGSSMKEISNHTDQQVHDKLRKKHFALAKGFYQLVNELNHYKGRNSVQNSSIRGYQDSSISAALSERRSRLAKIEPSIVTKVVSFICFQDQEVLL